MAAIPVVVLLLVGGWFLLKGSSPFSPTVPSYALTRAAEGEDPR